MTEIFSRTVCSIESAVSTVKDFCQQVCSGVRSLSLDDKRITFKLSDFKEHVCSLTNNLEQQQREIQDEVPYCRWLYDYVSRILRPQFVVKSREESVPIQFEAYEAEQINKYSSSQSDLVIYKAQEGLKSMDCCLISLQASALVAELKFNDKISYPMWECFHNMSAVGTHMAVKRLSRLCQ